MALIHWPAERREYFERIVHLLVRRHHGPQGWNVQRIEGRGGDTGVDILAKGPSGEYVVYQLKFFPDGLAGNSRKRQIQRSLSTAVQHHPGMTTWVLVVPCSLTLGQTDWFNSLAKGTPSAEVRFWDESRLDSLLSVFHDVREYVRRDDLFFEKARTLEQERAVLANPATDITKRLENLRDLANTVDPDFFVNMYADADGVRLTATPKHGDASQRLTTKFTFPEGYEHHLAELLELVNYGITEEITLPAQVIVAVEHHGPSFLNVEPPDGTRQTLTFGPEAEPEPIEMCILDEDAQTVGTHPGMVRITSGQKGVKLTAVFHEALNITWRLPLDKEEEQPVTQFTLSPQDSLPANVVSSCRLLRQVLACPRLEIAVKGTPIQLTTREPSTRVPIDAEIVQGTAEDLETVQRATETYFTYPEGLTPLDRAHLRVCRMLCEGRTTVAPQPFTVRVELGEPPPDTASPGLLRLEGQPVTFNVGRHELVLRNITIWHPRAWLEPAKESTNDGVSGYIVEPSGERFVLSPDGAASVPERWGLIDVNDPDPPELPEGLFTGDSGR